MKKRIFLSLCLTVLVTLAINTALSLVLYYHFYERQTVSDLVAHGKGLAQGLQASQDDVSFLSDYSGKTEGLRLTLIAEDGRVRYDNEADVNTMPNHKDRPEVQDALRYGIGSGERYSKTLAVATNYAAVRVPGSSDVIRLARDAKTLFGIFLEMLPLTVIIALLLSLVNMVAARWLTRWLLAPIDEAGEDLAAGRINDDGYDELAPFFETLRKQQETIQSQLSALQDEKDKITVIIENMSEGLVFLDSEQTVLSVNQSALRFFTPLVMPREGEHMLALSRNPDLLDAVEQAGQGVSATGLLEQGPRTARYFANPVMQEGTLRGVILLILDITGELKAKEAREDFSANVSHELKTPLTSISGFAEMMKNGMVSGKEDVINFSGMIYEEAKRLLVLIDDIMRLSSIEAGNEDREDVVSLRNVAETAKKRLATKAEARGVQVNVGGSAGWVRGNEVLLGELLTNLIDNAIKYNIENGRVTVGIQETEDEVMLAVSDTGIGIPHESQDRIFERFYRVDKSHSKETGGTGLGLSIVKHIVSRHKGRLYLDSTLGQGTTITAVFPLADRQSKDI